MATAAVLLLTACEPAPSDDTAAAIERIQAQAPAAEREWPVYHHDAANTQASPLNEITRNNVAQLEEIWRYDSGGASAFETQITTNPLVVRGVLYGLSAQKNLFALNAASGEEIWVHPFEQPYIGKGGGRGLVFWEGPGLDGKPSQRILVGLKHTLYAVDALTGKLIDEFGEDGAVDLRVGLDRPVDAVDVSVSAPGTVYKDLLIQGFGTTEVYGAAPGYIRAYHIPSGELRWTFRTIPAAGEFGADTWPEQRSDDWGAANSWAGIAVDESRGLAFVPTGSATYDFYGADRQGDNLFANTLLALNADTGQRVWHYQIVRHDLWDKDLPSPPNLLTVERDGVSIPAVSQATKSGHLFVFHRETGEPLFPIEEIGSLGPGTPGEFPAATQPLPTAPPAFATQQFEVTDLNRESTDFVGEKIDGMASNHPYINPSENGMVLYPGIDGGAEWGGQSYDAANGMLYVNSNEVPYHLTMSPSTRIAGDYTLADAYGMLCAGCHGADRSGHGDAFPSLRDIGERNWPWQTFSTIRDGRGRMPSFNEYWYLPYAMTYYLHFGASDKAEDGVEGKQGEIVGYVFDGYNKLIDDRGLPGSKPPWGSLAAIDINKGELVWKIPLGDYPEALELGLSGLGAENYGGSVVTAGGVVFIGATPDSQFRAFDSATGKLLWQTTLPAAGFATPTIYEASGRQLVVIAAGGGKLNQPSGSLYIAYGLRR